MDTGSKNTGNIDVEKQDWLDALDDLLETHGADRVKDILHDLQVSAHRQGVRLPFSANTPYINSIPRDQEPLFPGNRGGGIVEQFGDGLWIQTEHARVFQKVGHVLEGFQILEDERVTQQSFVMSQRFADQGSHSEFAGGFELR